MDIQKLMDWKNGKKEPKVMWKSEVPTECQLCSRPLVGVFYDAATVYGSWAIVGRCCFMTHTYGLGTGKGQKYDLETLEKLDG